MIEIKKINKTYQTKKGKTNHVLKDISLTFGNKGMTFITGKSGSGKSTLLNLLGGLDTYDSGDIILSGKSTKHFKSKDFDFYRNQYVGFIFQEFNILEDYSVYDNIILALNLQNKKVNPNEVDLLLQKLEIEQYKSRKVDELSGGQKQRVAIARALIKKPKVILADEPTGNLDSKTGIQVMELLKQISKDTLVIIVSHDMEFAKNYGDRIIELQDGVVTLDINNNVIEDSTESYQASKSKLPFIDAFKLGFQSLKKKKLRLSFTILLISFSSLFLVLAYILLTYNVTENHFRVLNDNHINTIEIKKFSYSENIPGHSKYTQLKVPLYLKEKDILEITKKAKNGYPTYIINNNNQSPISFFKLNIYESSILGFDPLEKEKDMYSNEIQSIQPKIIELDNKENLIEEKIIGHFPNEKNEIAISNYLADIIIQYGLYEYGTDTVYQPKSYEELVTSNHLFYFGQQNAVKITGIIAYDLSPFQTLKNKFYSQEQNNETLVQKMELLSQTVDNIYNRIYVKTGFINQLNKDATIELDQNTTFLANILNSPETIELVNRNLNIIDKETLYYDGKNFQTTNHLQKDEILLNISVAIPNYNDYKEKLDTYISTHPSLDKLEAEKEFLIQNYQLEDWIGKTVNLEIYEDCRNVYQAKKRKPNKTFHDIKIIGLTGLEYTKENYHVLFSKDLLETYINNPIKIDSIIIKEKNKPELKKLLATFPYHETYANYTQYSREIEFYYNSMLEQTDFIVIGFILFLIFSILLICNFMFTSISNRKKDIGILKSLGAKNSDIVKIFIFEGIIIAIISTVITLLFAHFCFDWLNHHSFSTTLTTISPFYINIKTIMVIFFYITIAILVSSIFPLHKISKMKPIDAIDER